MSTTRIMSERVQFAQVFWRQQPARCKQRSRRRRRSQRCPLCEFWLPRITWSTKRSSWRSCKKCSRRAVPPLWTTAWKQSRWAAGSRFDSCMVPCIASIFIYTTILKFPGLSLQILLVFPSWLPLFSISSLRLPSTLRRCRFPVMSKVTALLEWPLALCLENPLHPALPELAGLSTLSLRWEIHAHAKTNVE